ncbi:hypothetical protein [Streptomyces sp. NPDC058861]|uniref:hypothetical protein n=1 Tax=Streptomyces sp. NPDC058861 TaxID=3346653 RepID=UPI0036809F51
MPTFNRSEIVTRALRTACQCGESIEIEFVSDDSIATALGLTAVVTEAVARAALETWERVHECPPTVEELMVLLGLSF